MTAHMPPVPSDQRPPFQSDSAQSKADEGKKKRDAERQRNLGEQGRQGNIKQNTTNQGYQQDR